MPVRQVIQNFPVEHLVYVDESLFPDAYVDSRDHFLSSYSQWDQTIELEDGSFWRVNLFDMHKISSWAANDVLSLEPSRFFASNTYMITNLTTGSSVGVDLVVGPVGFGPNTHWVTGIDSWWNRVYLENGTCWDVRGLDGDLLAHWSANDTIICGYGKNEWFGSHDSILINVDLNEYVYANRKG